ncbi:hypothetical protein BJ508DRAFT_86941 [Ascobolus immersus RN42]|uniref:Uncharacterized protein n=1 Tax=Ascobolus immersus RN42 TaxID=1160509 RepID=A0A3N4IB28_ASCIM|nr:hypothetical protein BJ508DRAFT_86941 [Ascobolus immersus RN42]
MIQELILAVFFPCVPIFLVFIRDFFCFYLPALAFCCFAFILHRFLCFLMTVTKLRLS